MVLSNKEWIDKMNEIIAAIQNNGGDSQVIMDMLSNMWSSSVTYNVGDYVLYNNNIWKCLVQNSNIAPSEGTTWTRTNITNEISTLNSKLVYRDVYIGDRISIGEEGYAIIQDYIPSVEGYTLLSTAIKNWSAGMPYNITSNGVYLIAKPSSGIQGITIRYIFIRN